MIYWGYFCQVWITTTQNLPNTKPLMLFVLPSLQKINMGPTILLPSFSSIFDTKYGNLSWDLFFHARFTPTKRTHRAQRKEGGEHVGKVASMDKCLIKRRPTYYQVCIASSLPFQEVRKGEESWSYSNNVHAMVVGLKRKSYLHIELQCIESHANS